MYEKLADSASFKTGIARLLKGIDSYRVGIVCSEEDPQFCHRRLLVGRVLVSMGISLCHIRGNGQVELEREVHLPDNSKMPQEQSRLFAPGEAESWKSIRSVSQKSLRQSSSES